MRTRLLLLLIVAAVCAAGPEVARPTEEISTAKLVVTMRALNTLEYSYKDEHGKFAAREELLKFLPERMDAGKIPVDLSNPEVVDLRVTTSPDGRHYQIGIKQLIDSNDEKTWCRTSVFSDDAGVIYLGAGLDCPTETK